MNRILFAISVLVLPLMYGLPSYAEETTDSLSAQVFFRQNRTEIEPEFRSNKVNLGRFVYGVKEILSDTTCRIQDIYIRSGASPEGSFEHNRNLSRKRAVALKYYLKRELDLPNEIFFVDPVGEDWISLLKAVEESDIPDREDVLDILDRHHGYIYGSPTSSVGGPKKELMDLHGGRTWFWLLENIFPDLRSACNNILCRYVRISKETAKPHSSDTVVVIHKYILEVDTGKIQGSANSKSQSDTVKKNQVKGPGYRIDIEADMKVEKASSRDVELKLPEGKNVVVNIVE